MALELLTQRDTGKACGNERGSRRGSRTTHARSKTERGRAVIQRLLRILLFAGLVVSLVFLASRLQGFYWPGNQQDYEPEQPIAFSHKLHSGKLQIACIYCHSGAERSRHAGIPAASLCMNCHRLVTAPRDAVLAEYRQAQQARRPARPVVSTEMQKLYDALGLDDKLQPDPAKAQKPIAWVRVHNLPAFTCFDHRPHVTAGVACQQCHGPVETMDRVRQATNLSMGWCVNCHRDTHGTEVAGRTLKPSTDCSACHY